MKKTTILLLLLFSLNLYSQETFFTAFWNVENLFDTIDQPDTDDAEFLPGSEKQWDESRFRQKLINLATVIMSMNRGKGPDILGICEVENKAVIESLLVYLNPGYSIVHIDSPDGRGIDNAFLYTEKTCFLWYIILLIQLNLETQIRAVYFMEDLL
jgi:hypothetical protein